LRRSSVRRHSLFCFDSSHTRVCDNEVRVAKNLAEGIVGDPDHEGILGSILFFATDPCLTESIPLVRQGMTDTLTVPLDERKMPLVLRDIAGHT